MLHTRIDAYTMVLLALDCDVENDNSLSNSGFNVSTAPTELCTWLTWHDSLSTTCTDMTHSARRAPTSSLRKTCTDMITQHDVHRHGSLSTTCTDMTHSARRAPTPTQASCWMRRRCSFLRPDEWPTIPTAATTPSESWRSPLPYCNQKWNKIWIILINPIQRSKNCKQSTSTCVIFFLFYLVSNIFLCKYFYFPNMSLLSSRCVNYDGLSLHAFYDVVCCFNAITKCFISINIFLFSLISFGVFKSKKCCTES